MQYQQCVTCKQSKPIDEFSWRHRLVGERHIHCRDCQRTYKRNHYLRHKVAYIERSKKQKEESVLRNRRLVQEYLKTHPCVDCGESDPIVLEFDHVGKKDRTVAKLVLQAVSWEKILKEIQQCQIRCANCHRRKTAQQLGWYKKLGL